MPQAKKNAITNLVELPFDHFTRTLQIRRGTEVFSNAIDIEKVAIAKKKEVPPKEVNTVFKSNTLKNGIRNIVANEAIHIGTESQIHKESANPKSPNEQSADRVIPSDNGRIFTSIRKSKAMTNPRNFLVLKVFVPINHSPFCYDKKTLSAKYIVTKKSSNQSAHYTRSLYCS